MTLTPLPRAPRPAASSTRRGLTLAFAGAALLSLLAGCEYTPGGGASPTTAATQQAPTENATNAADSTSAAKPAPPKPGARPKPRDRRKPGANGRAPEPVKPANARSEAALELLATELDPTPDALSRTTDRARERRIGQTATLLLNELPVAKRTEWDGYFQRQESFGDGWLDPDGNGCDARNDSLQENLTRVEVQRDRCRVQQGVLVDPYTGETISFRRGKNTSDEVQIDHVVALYNAWRTGAKELTFDERVLLANDPINLQPTDGDTNDDKGSQDASQWLPPNRDYHCDYVARQVYVKRMYALWVTPKEKSAMRRVLSTCGS